MLHDPVSTQSALGQPAVLLEDRVVEDVHVAGHPVFAAGVAQLEEVQPRGVGRSLAASIDVAPDVEWSDGCRRVADPHHGLRDVVSPHPHVAAAALHFQAVVPAVADDVAVDVRIGAGRSAETAVASPADHIVVHVLKVGKALIVPDHVVSGRVEQRNALRPLRVIAELGVPRAAVAGGMVQLAPLDDEAFQALAMREDGCLVVEPEAGLGIEPAPVGDVAALDDNVVATLDTDRADRFPGGVLGRPGALERQSADDHVGSVDRDARIVPVADVDRGASAIVHPVGVGRA